MKVSLEKPIKRWAAQFPQTVEAISAMHEAGARVALTSSRLTQLVAEATGQEVLRRPDDTDLLVPHNDLALAASVLGARVERDKRVRLQTGDGYNVRFTVDELTAEADSIIQMVCPQEPLRVGRANYDTAYTDVAAGARQVYETDQGLVPVAATDSLFLYGVMQRNHGVKHDAHNAAILQAARTGTDPYDMYRSYEMGLDARAWNFIQGSGAAVAHAELRLAA